MLCSIRYQTDRYLSTFFFQSLKVSFMLAQLQQLLNHGLDLTQTLHDVYYINIPGAYIHWCRSRWAKWLELFTAHLLVYHWQPHDNLEVGSISAQKAIFPSFQQIMLQVWLQQSMNRSTWDISIRTLVLLRSDWIQSMCSAVMVCVVAAMLFPSPVRVHVMRFCVSVPTIYSFHFFSGVIFLIKVRDPIRF